jgi:hypothetical protein
MVMKFLFNSTVAFALVTFVSSLPVRVKRDVDPSLVPEFGVEPGVNPTGTGNCDGIKNAQGQVIKIPCSCPPDRNSFIESLNANVAAGHVVNNPSVPLKFPEDDSKASNITRIQAAIVTLQNLNGPGRGCPAASTTFSAQLQAAQNGPDTPNPSASNGVTPSNSSTRGTSPNISAPGTSSNSSTSGGQISLVNPALVPDLGHQAGLNPDGHGNCDGITNSQGQVVKVPCSCPPDRDAFIKLLSENVAAGRAVNNTAVSVSFPTDDSKTSQAARIVASIITLQNLDGPGKGCPAASTTLSAQLNAVQE